MEKLSQHSHEISDSARSFAADILSLPIEDTETRSVSGGYSRNQRALVGKGDNWVFVKEVDVDVLDDEGEEELWWLQKDHLCTEALRPTVPHLVPTWSKLGVDGHVLVMEAYRSEDGWSWQLPTDAEELTRYIQTVVDATKSLEEVEFDEVTIRQLKLEPYFRDKLASDDGLTMVLQDKDFRISLIDRFETLSKKDSALPKSCYQQMLDFLGDEQAIQQIAKQAASLIEQPNNKFGHMDVRSDNIAYNSSTGEIKFVDWNWASYSPYGFGASEFLTDMARRGNDVSPWLGDINPEMLSSVVGFYLKRCMDPPLYPGSTLRDMQAESAAAALDILRRV